MTNAQNPENELLSDVTGTDVDGEVAAPLKVLVTGFFLVVFVISGGLFLVILKACWDDPKDSGGVLAFSSIIFGFPAFLSGLMIARALFDFFGPKNNPQSSDGPKFDEYGDVVRQPANGLRSGLKGIMWRLVALFLVGVSGLMLFFQLKDLFSGVIHTEILGPTFILLLFTAVAVRKAFAKDQSS